MGFNSGFKGLTFPPTDKVYSLKWINC